jgi:beta-N-acetylhexosaminidase
MGGLGSDTSGTKKAARTTAAMLKDAGFSCNFAPVVDINYRADNPVIGAMNRSFSDDPGLVVSHAEAWIIEHRKRGIISCVKHFPGHGSSAADSHAGFVDITDVWDESELIPYRELHRRKLIDAVMTGHLFNRRIDPDYPATMSNRTINGLLRTEIGYDGVVFSDDLQMRAITDRYPFEEAVCRTLAAGVDILVFGNNLDYDPGVCPKAIDALKAGIEKGLIAEKQVKNALRRVRNLKQAIREHARS